MPNTDSFMQQMGQAAGGGILGIGMQAIGNELQRKQQMKLMQAQTANQKQLMDYQNIKQMQMWRDTSYGPQMQQMKMAGINPALMYGMSGGGGQTAGGGMPGGAMPSAEGSHAILGMGMTAAHLGLIKAQAENIKADTELKKTDATKKSGVDTENVKADTKLKQVEEEIKQVQASVSRQTINEQMKAWEQLVEKNTAEINGQNIDNALKTEQITLVKKQVINAMLEAANIEARTNLTKEETAAIGERLLQTDRELDIKDRERQIKEALAVYEMKHPGLTKVIGGALESVLNSGDTRKQESVKPIPKKER